MEERVRFARADALGGIDGRFDLVVSNPPYIPSSDIAGLSTEVREYDPLAALDGGPDGLDIYRRIITGLGQVLDGWAVFEVGAGQAETVALLLQQAFVKTRQAEVSRHTDLAGQTRCVSFKLQS